MRNRSDTRRSVFILVNDEDRRRVRGMDGLDMTELTERIDEKWEPGEPGRCGGALGREPGIQSPPCAMRRAVPINGCRSTHGFVTFNTCRGLTGWKAR